MKNDELVWDDAMYRLYGLRKEDFSGAFEVWAKSLAPEDFDRARLPVPLAPYRSKCFGLTIDPDRLHHIRHERRPDSKYASLENCRFEVHEAEAMMRREGISWLSSTHKSIEEIATTILRDLRPDRLMY